MSTSIFKTHPAHIAQIKAVIKAKGRCWFHGDGNLYDDDGTPGNPSHNRMTFNNPMPNNVPSPASYRVLFTNVNQVPDTVDGLNEALAQAKSREIQQSVQAKAQGIVVNTIDVEPHKPTAAADDLEGLKAALAALKAENESLKAKKAGRPKKEAEEVNTGEGGDQQ